jgi:hypothetical protein
MWGLGGQQERRGRNEGSELVQGALYTYMKWSQWNLFIFLMYGKSKSKIKNLRNKNKRGYGLLQRVSLVTHMQHNFIYCLRWTLHERKTFKILKANQCFHHQNSKHRCLVGKCSRRPESSLPIMLTIRDLQQRRLAYFIH